MGTSRPPAGSARPNRRGARRRTWTTPKVLLLVVAVVAGGTALYPAWRHSGKAPESLNVRYKAGSSASARVAQPWLEVVNVSKKTVSLSDVTIRYYFTADGARSYAVNCVKATVGCSNISERIVAMTTPTPTADHYVQVSFTPGAGTLSPGAKSEAIGLLLYRPDGKKADQTNDRSFDAADTTFQPSRLVTAYLQGKPAWGDEPEGQTSADVTQAPVTATPKPAPPRGVVFDDFHYSGPADPTLRAHGWLVRSGRGGPGILNTWSSSGVSFPDEPSATGGQLLDLRAESDGTTAGTKQSELQSTGIPFDTGTYAARIHFVDKPTTGRNGDHINESFYMISPNNSRYSELDYEYQPNGGWGAPGPRLDTVSWHNANTGDRVTQKTMASLEGWHTLVVTAAHDVVTYTVDGKTVFTSRGRYYPRENMSVNFNSWFVDLPFSGPRTWDMQVDWFYYNATKAQSLTDVQKTVRGLTDNGTNYVNTVSAS